MPDERRDEQERAGVEGGTIDPALPDRTLTLGQGDVLVQAGNRHSWVNRSDEYCRLLVVVLTGQRPPAP